eukprot:TRINITY_DN122610_c0_g1_i1.p1 TRINITY_DN122610_c0_g1~~TRINITY_DN122610_c0_g1_i1.p1  ORF type:complete len:314 (-),score=95.26 TRINITY_DN122610_c0_g1_i1:142-1083(-)
MAMGRSHGYNVGADPPIACHDGAAAAPAATSAGYPADAAQDAEAPRLSVHEANRVKKAVEQNVKAIENRIRFFQREEEKIWKDLEEVRRQASIVEDGRSRIIEKKRADQSIAKSKESQLQVNRQRAAATRQAVIEQRKQQQYAQSQAKLQAGQEQRRASAEILRQKRMQEAQTRLANSEKAVAIQRAQLEARLRVNQERADKLERLREEQEAERLAAEEEVHSATARLPDLEAEEMMCLQRLQNSRIVTQSVLEELESSLGSKSSVTNMLRLKQQKQDGMSTGLSGLSEEGLAADDQENAHDHAFGGGHQVLA